MCYTLASPFSWSGLQSRWTCETGHDSSPLVPSNPCLHCYPVILFSTTPEASSRVSHNSSSLASSGFTFDMHCMHCCALSCNASARIKYPAESAVAFRKLCLAIRYSERSPASFGSSISTVDVLWVSLQSAGWVLFSLPETGNVCCLL